VPDPAFGAGAFVGLDDARSSLFAVAGRVAAVAVTSSPDFQDGVGARFTWILLRPEACPLRPLRVYPVRLELCAMFDLGVLATQGRGLDRPKLTTRVWLAPGVSARLASYLARTLMIEASAGVLVPLRQYPFAYESGNSASTVRVHEVPWAAGAFSLGMAYRFP